MNKPVLYCQLAALLLLGASSSALAQAIIPGATYKITQSVVRDPATGSPLCLDVDNNLPDPGTRIHQWLDNGNDAQRFIFEQQADGSFKLRHKGTAMYVQTIGESKVAGAQLEQNASSSNDAQHWIVTDEGAGLYKLTMRGTANPPQCLEIGFGSDIPGAVANIWDDNGFRAQRFELAMMELPTGTKNPSQLAFKAKAFPNPFSQNQTLNVQVQTIDNGPADVALVDMLGREVYSQQVYLNFGANNIVLANREQIATGVYMLRVRQGTSARQIRVVQN